MTNIDAYRALWRRKLFILGMTAIFVGVTWYLTVRQTPIYEASTLVRIQQSANDPDQARDSIEAAQQLTQTYAKIIETGALSERVLRQIPAERRGAVSSLAAMEAAGEELVAEPVESLDLLTVFARSPTPARAEVLANATPAALQAFIKETGTAREQIIPVSPARLPESPASPNLLLNLALALALGLILNGALALVFELLSDRLPEPDDLEASIGLPVLAIVPTLDFPKSDRAARGGEPERAVDGKQPATTKTGSPPQVPSVIGRTDREE